MWLASPTYLTLAIETVAMDGQVLDISDKPESPNQELFKRFDDRLIHIHHFAAPFASQVMMVTLFDMVIEKPIFSKVSLSHQTYLFQKLQCSIDSRTVSLRVPGTDPLVDGVRTDMSFSIM